MYHTLRLSKLFLFASIFIFTHVVKPGEENVPLRRLSFREGVCTLWHITRIVSYVMSIEHAILDWVLFDFKSRSNINGINSNLESIEIEPPSCLYSKETLWKIIITVGSIKDASSVSLGELSKRATILALTQSFIGETVIKYFAIPRILRRLNIQLVDEENEPLPIIKGVFVINRINVVNYCYNTIQYLVWLNFIRRQGSNSCIDNDSVIDVFIKSMVFQMIYDVAVNSTIDSIKYLEKKFNIDKRLSILPTPSCRLLFKEGISSILRLWYCFHLVENRST